jgi:hypothetical protein
MGCLKLDILEREYTPLKVVYRANEPKQNNVQRFYSTDPKPDPSVSPYAMFKGNPIMYSDRLLDSVAFILDKEGASRNGHMAMLFQNDDGQWNYFSVGAAKQNAEMVGKGTQAKTTFQPMTKVTKSGEVVNMTLDEAFAATKKGMSDGNAYDEMAVFNTNKKEDAIISKNVTNLKSRFDNGTDLYQLWNNNCADACQDAIEGIPAKGGTKTGIKTPSDESTPRPNGYFPKIKDAAKKFNYPYKNMAQPSGLDNFPSKPIYQQVDRNTNQPVLNTPTN